MNSSLYVASRSGVQEQGNWGVVARLDRVADGWRFLYLHGAKTLQQFRHFYEFPDLDAVYEKLKVYQKENPEASRNSPRREQSISPECAGTHPSHHATGHRAAAARHKTFPYSTQSSTAPRAPGHRKY